MSSLVTMPRRDRRMVFVPLLIAAALLLGMGIAPAHALGAPLYGVSRTQTGLVASDPLNAPMSQSQLAGSSFWKFGGDAVGENAPYAFTEDSGGLHIGVQATSQYPYAGLYGLHIADAVLAHAVITAPSRTVPSGYPNVGLYIQTGGTNVDYVFCGETTASYGTDWGVSEAVGNPNGAQQYIPLWYDTSADQPLTRSCTIVTNGQNYLAAYLDGKLVFQADNLQLGYQEPFQFFLETQTSYQGAMFTGTFQDFYLTSSDSVTVTNMPASSSAEIVDPSGQVLASAQANGGTATLGIGQFNMPLVGKIVITQLGLQVGSSSQVSIWGGDSYRVSLLGLGLGGLQTPVSGVASSTQQAGSGASSAVGSVSSNTGSLVGSVSSTLSPITTISLIAVVGAALSKRDDGDPLSLLERKEGR